MIHFKKLFELFLRLRLAVQNHGFLWTLEKSISLLRVRLENRNVGVPLQPVASAIKGINRSYFYSPDLINEIGVVPSVRPKNEDDYAFKIPFDKPLLHNVQKVAVIVHIFYVEYAEEILKYINNIPVTADLFISTDTAHKKKQLEEIFLSYDGGSKEFRVTPNKGRDIGPKLVGFSNVYENYEYFLHIHSKRSPHGGDGLKEWRVYLLDHLLGSVEIINSNLALLSHPSIGMVFAQHLFGIRGVLNWGYDFDFAKNLLARAGIVLNKGKFLEFPSGSMFWARSAALKKLFDLNLNFDDFEEEAGKIDGTLAHAIERSYLFFVESAGFKWAKISLPKNYPLQKTLLPVHLLEDIDNGMNFVYNTVLSNPVTVYSPLERSLSVTRRILVTPSLISRPRINLVIPTVNPSQVFGGVATALKVFDSLVEHLRPEFDVRIIVTDAAIDAEGLENFKDYALSIPDWGNDIEGRSLVDLSTRHSISLMLRKNDIFLVSAWWNAKQVIELGENQKEYFGRHMPLIYLIQDFEPNFNGWSTQWAIAENTYKQCEDMIAIINSNELYIYMMARYNFKNASLLPYLPNAKIISALVKVDRQKKILIYGRPSVVRNCFELVLEGLLLWQSKNPIQAAEWVIVSVGEQYPAGYAVPLQNFSVQGKLDLDAYGKILSESSIGISLMVSPHPSYPPLEMAQAGLVTITNKFENKDLSEYCDSILNIESFTAQALADTIEMAIEKVFGRSASQLNTDSGFKVPVACGPAVDYRAIAADIKNRVPI